jgi:methylthioribulose-1-phosphate dehydratase
VTADPLAATGAALATEAARFASFGWMRGTSGNLSAVLSRDPLRVAVTASGKDKGELTPADIVVVDSTGRCPPDATAHRPAEARIEARPSAEAALHTRIVRLTGASAVVHVHTLASVIAGRRWPDGPVLTGLEMLKGIGVPASGEAITIPVVPNSQDMAELANRVEMAWNPKVPAVVVADHGLYAWGADLRQARHHTEIVQWLLELAIALG